jgi:hypothetical protein
MGFLSGLFGGTTTTKTETTPWAPQATALQDVFKKAGGLYASKEGTPWYQGDLYANMDPATANAIKGMLSYTQGQGADSAGQLTSTGSNMLGANAAGFNGAVGNVASMAGQDPTRANITSAGAYADNPYLSGQIDAASRDVRRNLTEDTLPSIDRAAVGSGNINSSRAGIASGITMRGAQDQIGDIASNMRGAAYSQGLNLAENARTANMGAMNNAASLYGSGVGQGADLMGQGNNMATGGFKDAIGAGQIIQQDQQGQNDADLQRWQGNDTRAADLLDRYYNIIGNQNWGGTQTSTGKTSGNIFGQISGAVATAAGAIAGGGSK